MDRIFNSRGQWKPTTWKYLSQLKILDCLRSLRAFCYWIFQSDWCLYACSRQYICRLDMSAWLQTNEVTDAQSLRFSVALCEFCGSSLYYHEFRNCAILCQCELPPYIRSIRMDRYSVRNNQLFLKVTLNWTYVDFDRKQQKSINRICMELCNVHVHTPNHISNAFEW